MAKEGKKALVPKLRFPEFRDAEEWKPKLLGEVCGMQAGKFIAASEISEKQSEGLHPCFGGNGLRGYTRNYNQSGRYSLIGRQGALCGNVILVEGDFYATEHAVVTTPKAGISTDWNFYNLYLLNLNRFATGQAQPGLSVDVLEKVNCAVPKDEKEQKKIADCLSSLDELIAAQGRKVEALKTYKRGLMQQLFPREGENLPRLRFPEFRDAPAELVTVGEFAKVTTGAKDTQNKVDGGTYPFFVRSQNVERIDSFSYDGEAVLTSGDGVGVGENYHYINGRFDFHQRVYCICDYTHETSGKFFFHYFSTHFKKRVKQMSAKNSVDSVRMSMITEMPVWMPSLAEQLRIAECLSSLDTKITAESATVEAFEAHKRGLMQQLFPSLEEA